MTTPRYKSNAGVVFNLNYHIVFCPKYRRSVLVGDIETRLKELLHEKANALGVEVAMLEVMPDHVHLFITAPPLSPRRLMTHLNIMLISSRATPPVFCVKSFQNSNENCRLCGHARTILAQQEPSLKMLSVATSKTKRANNC
jgi:hypothetical protein